MRIVGAIGTRWPVCDLSAIRQSWTTSVSAFDSDRRRRRHLICSGLSDQCKLTFGIVTSTTLEQIYRLVWDRLDVAAREGPDAAFTSLQAATIGLDGFPNVRTVALRSVNALENRITFHTDLRSPKVAELTRIPRIALVGFDPNRHTQIRVFGEARVVSTAPYRLDAWKNSPDHELVQYRTRLSPGTPVDRPADAFGHAHMPSGPEEGFSHFCIVEVSPDRLDWLDLSAADNPIRAQFVRKDASWCFTWVAP